MSESRPNYRVESQLPLFGLVYSEVDRECEYLLAGIRISRESRPSWEKNGLTDQAEEKTNNQEDASPTPEVAGSSGAGGRRVWLRDEQSQAA